MAGKVNTKFVVGLSVALVAAAGLASAAGVFLYQRTAPNLIKQGDRLYEKYEGQAKGGENDDSQKTLKLAIASYAKAVNKDDTNLAYIHKWEGAMSHLTPQEGPEFEKAFSEFQILRRSLARLEKNKPELHALYLDSVYENVVRFPGNKVASERLTSETNDTLKYFKGDATGDTLRRYRGLATLDQYLVNNELEPARIEQGEQDLEAALAANPKDELTAEGLIRWHERTADRARALSKPDDAAAAMAAARKVADDFLQANPGAPRVLIARFRLDVREQQAKIAAKNDPRRAREDYAAMRTTLKPGLDALLAKLNELDAGMIDQDVTERFSEVERVVDPAGRGAGAEALTTRAIAAHPNDAELLLGRAEQLATSGKAEEAIALAAKILDLPRLPVSTEAAKQFRVKSQAYFMRCLWAFDAWDRASGEEKTKNLARMKEFRDQLRTRVEENQAPMQLVNAQVAFAEDNLALSSRLLKSFNEQTRYGAVEGLLLEAVVAQRQSKPGLAIERLQQVLAVRPTAGAVISLAQLYAGTGRGNEALQLLKQTEGDLPKTKEIQDFIAQLDSQLTGRKVGNPMLDIPAEASRLVQDKKMPEAIKLLQDGCRDNNQDPRLVTMLVRLQIANTDTAGAITSLEAAIAARPGEASSKALQAILNGLRASTPLEQEIAVNDGLLSEPGQEVERGLGRFSIYQRYGKQAETEAALADLVKIAPTDVRVMELQFIAALEKKDFDTATKIADDATSRDADGAEGLTYRARLQRARGQLREAIATLEDAVGRISPNPEMLRLLGRFRIEAGRYPAAVEAFDRAVKIRETDVASVKDLIGALVMAGRGEDALERARAARKTQAASDEQFIMQWLSLEAELGDRATALDGRRQIARVKPTDRGNLLALAGLLVIDKQLDEARQIIDKLKAEKNDLEACAAEAAWYDAKGDVANAKKTYEEFIKSQGSGKVPVQAYLAFARYQGSKTDIDGMLATLEQARAHQDPKVMEADQSLADVLFRLGRDSQAIEAAKRVIEGGADTERRFQKQIASTLIRRGDFSGAESELAPLKPLEGTDASILIMRSQAALGRKDDTTGRRLADEAIARFPELPATYVHRARLLARKPETQRDALADMDKAVSLDKTSAGLLLERAGLHQMMGKEELAIRDRRDAVVLAPGDARLRREVLQDLLASRRYTEAVETAEQVFTQSRNNAGVGLDLGATFAQFAQWPRAMRFYRGAFEAQNDPAVGAAYVNALLNQNPPDINTAGEVLRRVEGKAEYNLHIARSRWLWMQGQKQDSLRAATESLRLRNPARAEEMTNWYGVVKSYVTDPKDLVPYLEATEKAGVVPSWARFFRANTLFDDPTKRTPAVELFHELTSPANTTTLRQLSYEKLSSALYEMGRYDDVVSISREGLQSFPDDAALLNNLAYTLAQNLNKPEEALPFAEKAAQIAGGTPEALDTLGYVQFKLNRLSDARSTLDRAANMPQMRASLVSTLNHLAAVCLAQGDKDAALIALNECENQLKGADEKSIPKESRDEFAALKARAQ